jgi:hypothetical protein
MKSLTPTIIVLGLFGARAAGSGHQQSSGMNSRPRPTVLGIVAMIVVVAGIVALVAGSHAMHGAGLTAIVLIVLLLAAPHLANRRGGVANATMGRVGSRPDVPNPEPQYIDKAAEVLDGLWPREHRRYVEKSSPPREWCSSSPERTSRASAGFHPPLATGGNAFVFSDERRRLGVLQAVPVVLCRARGESVRRAS